ncbi:MAG: hypothetical protein QM783_01175 [Phycisphaerales bacterium]
MNGWQIALLVCGLLTIDFVIIGAVASACAATLGPLVTAFPPVEPASDAVRRKFQSFRFDLFNFGGCVHVAADSAHLHLRPARLARWFGLRDMSIPWSAVQLRKVSGKSAVAEIGKSTVRGPAWCLSLAAPGEQT